MDYRTVDRDLIGLDLLRFLLSLSILVYHFPHFAFPFNELDQLDKRILPFSSALMFLYRYGDVAVRIFWMISGIIFFHFYAERIANGAISFKKFAFFRFTRLYPLHLLALISVAILQHFYFLKFNEAFINPANTVINFILNLLMINYWSSKFGLSFNGPFWSVSVEIFVYIIFFLLAYAQAVKKTIYTSLLTIVFFVLYFLGILNPFHECLLYFFLGCLVAQNLQRIGLLHMALLFLTVALAILLTYYTPIMKSEIIARAMNCCIRLGIGILLVTSFSKLFRIVRLRNKNLLRALGNMTYSMYMIHYSIQITLIFIFFDKGWKFFNTTVFLTFYIVITATLGLIVYRFFEAPIQEVLRKKVIRDNK